MMNRMFPGIRFPVVSFFLIIATFIACNSRPEQDKNLIYTAHAWYPSVDSYGSQYRIDDELITNGIASVNFTIATKSDSEEWTPWVEMVCDLGYTIENYSGLEITYTNDTALLVKLSQSDFGPAGNETYSHYEYRLPPSDDWQSFRIKFDSFTQPYWTPQRSREIPLILENINAVYLVPDLDPAIGESSELSVRHLELF